MEKKVEIENVIMAVSDPRSVSLLIDVYINNRSLTETADRMGYSYTWITTLHNNALDLVVLPEHI